MSFFFRFFPFLSLPLSFSLPLLLFFSFSTPPPTTKHTSQDHPPSVAERVVLFFKGDRGLPRRRHDRDAAAAERREQPRRLAVFQQLAEVSSGAVALKHRLGSRERGGGRGLVVVVVVVTFAVAAPLSPTSSTASSTTATTTILPVPLAGGQGGFGLSDLAREPSDLLGEAVRLVDDAQVVRGDAGGEGAALFL